MRRSGCLALLFGALFCSAVQTAQDASRPTILQIDLDDIVHPVSADYVRAGLDEAAKRRDRAVLLRVDTPGGLSDSMREIVEGVLASPVPVVVWVGPNGARAASAGFFVLLAGDIAAMASATNTGAAHPVTIGGGKIDDVMEKKVVSDASAYIRAYSAKRGRNAVLAEQAVTESRSFTAEEALKENLIDLVADDTGQLVQKLDGRKVRRLDGSEITLALAGTRIDLFEMTARQRLLSNIVNPNIALLLGLIGLIGLYIEMTHPGLILPGVAGAICLVLALFAFNLLPVSWTGVALIVLAIGLFVLEATIVSHGILALGGIVAMIAGGLLLVEGPIPELRIHLATIIAITLPIAAITIFLVRLVYRTHRKKSVTGESGMIGEIGVARTDIHDQGRVLVHGELWNASSRVVIPAGKPVRVVNIHGLKVEVEPESEA